MQILVTLDFPPEKGGIQRYLDGIVRHSFRETDSVFAGLKNRCRAENHYSCKVNYFTTPLSVFNKKFSLIPLTLALFRIIKKSSLKPHIECGNVYAAFAPWIVSKFMETEYSVYTYGTELIPLNKRGIRSFFLRKVLVESKTIFTLGSYTCSLLHKAGIKNTSHVVAPKIEMPPLFPKKKQADVLRILTVGRLVYHKGHDLLLEALSVMPLPVEWSLVIAGNGPQKKKLKKMAFKLGIDNRVCIKEKLSDRELLNEYRVADLFALCSRDCARGAEGFGIVLLEAMAHEIPVIASNSGGIPEVLDYGRCGLLFKSGDVFALARSITIMLQDYAFRERCICEASKKLKSCHVW